MNKSAAQINPLTLALLGGGLGLGVQGIRRMMQSKREQEQEGSPSLMNGLLLGALLGGGYGAAQPMLRRYLAGLDKKRQNSASPAASAPPDISREQQFTPAGRDFSLGPLSSAVRPGDKDFTPISAPAQRAGLPAGRVMPQPPMHATAGAAPEPPNGRQLRAMAGKPQPVAIPTASGLAGVHDQGHRLIDENQSLIDAIRSRGSGQMARDALAANIRRPVLPTSRFSIADATGNPVTETLSPEQARQQLPGLPESVYENPLTAVKGFTATEARQEAQRALANAPTLNKLIAGGTRNTIANLVNVGSVLPRVAAVAPIAAFGPQMARDAVALPIAGEIARGVTQGIQDYRGMPVVPAQPSVPYAPAPTLARPMPVNPGALDRAQGFITGRPVSPVQIMPLR